jgi:enoyl-CoA hydratase/carnithine racemase
VEAERYGVINRALPPAELDAYVEDTVTRLARRSRRVIGINKQVSRTVYASFADAMFAGFGAENDGLRDSLSRPDVHHFLSTMAKEAQTRDTEQDLPAFIERVTADVPFD